MFQSEARCPAVCLHVSGVFGAARVAVYAAPHEAHLCCEFISFITCIWKSQTSAQICNDNHAVSTNEKLLELPVVCRQNKSSMV